jgi:hypothetical protein
MLDASVWYGTVLRSNSSEIVIFGGANETIYSGNFTYDSIGTIHGTLTGITEINNGAYAYVATSLNVDATFAQYYIQSDNLQPLFQAALAGNDQFIIEPTATGTHVIDGYGGYNIVYEPGPSTSYVFGSAGGGPGEHDTLYNIQVVYFPDGFVNMTNGVFYPTGGDADWIVLQNTSGPLALWRMSGTTIIGGGLAGNPGPTWHVEGTGHFLFGDGNTDIVWQNDNGSVAVWGIDGITVRGGGLVASNPGPTWHVEGTGHFFGDVYSDILFQNDNGSVAVWQMSGTNIVGGGLVASSPGPTWHVEGTGKFFNDGNSAILFQNDDGSVALWDMSGTNIVGGGLVTTSNPGPTWHIKGTGDFYGDGHTDILWQNDNGSVALWDMSGTNIVGGGLVVASDPGPTWHIKATGDFNFDGHTDIAFQNDNGTVAIWDMNGTNIIGGGVVTNPGTAWGVHDDNMQFTYSTTADETLAATPATPDEFVLTNFAAGSHTISGFNPVQDMIEFSKAQFGSFADVQEATSAISGGAMINLGNGSSLLLPGVNPASLHASDFALV